mmetsp:Transcript_43033/g.137477  ORF Transcript_43033/g.137477 Transcript_43033/m.137477 type:complete len:197 (-) Transcript_43033:359-949(-)
MASNLDATPAAPGVPATKAYKVKVSHGEHVMARMENDTFDIELAADGSDSIESIKKKIAEKTNGAVSADMLMLQFGPNEKTMGAAYQGDPSMDESATTISQYSCLLWLDQFPHWYLLARLLPLAPPAPGVAAARAAAMAEGKDPDAAVAERRKAGDLPKIEDLPAPWGPKPLSDFRELVTPPPQTMVKREDFVRAQ